MRLNVRDVTFGYESRPVLEDVTLDVAAGEMLGLVGPNGSGKSTLLRCINRVLAPNTGTVFVDGTDLHDLSREEIARRVGYVPQEASDAFPSTVFDTVLMGRKPHIGWQPTDEDLDLVAEIVDLLGLEVYAMRAIDEISGGQRQKVLIGRALAQEAAVLVLDEPTSSLDLRHQLEVMELLTRRVREEDVAAVVALHDLNLAARYCQKVVMLHDREVYAAGGPEVLTPEHIRAVYDVEVRTYDDGDRRVIVPVRSTADRENRTANDDPRRSEGAGSDEPSTDGSRVPSEPADRPNTNR